MSLLEDVVPAPRREKIFFFVVDTGEKINGHTMFITRLMLEDIIRCINQTMVLSDDVEVKIAVLQFGGCTWATSEFEPVNIDDFFLNDHCKHEMNGFKQALVELNNKLDKNGFLTADCGCYAPVITFIGSGHTSDNLDKQIESLKNNFWYRHAIKIAIKTDTTSDSILFEKITGNVETVFDISQMDSIRVIYKRLFDDFVS